MNFKIKNSKTVELNYDYLTMMAEECDVKNQIETAKCVEFIFDDVADFRIFQSIIKNRVPKLALEEI